MDFQSIRSNSQYPGGYDHELVAFLVKIDARTPRQIAKDAGISHTKLYAAMDGDLKKIETLTRLSKTFDVHIKEFFEFDRKKFDRKKFRRSVLNGGSRSGR